MAGTKNLRDIRTRTTEEVREIGRKGGIASGKARRERKSFREIVQRINEMEAPSKVLERLKEAGINEEDATYQTAVVLKMFHEAMNGDVSAFKALVKIAGEAIERHEVTGRDGEPLQVDRELSMVEIRAKLKELDEE